MRKYRGTCFCGAVEIEVSHEPIDAGYCHCASCRTYSGAPFVAFAIWPIEQFRIITGSGKLGSFNKAGTSERRFCRLCGGHLFLEHAHLGVVDVRAAILPELEFKPRSHLNYAERVISICDGLPKFRDMPGEIGGTGELMAEEAGRP